MLDGATDFIIDREAYRVAALLSVREFVSFCRDRNMDVQPERLRHLERLGLFLPLLRIYRIDIVHKIELVDDGRRYRDLGEMREDEVWGGDVRTELAEFAFSRRIVQSWRDHGSAWNPRTQTSPHAATIDSEPRRHEAYYSQFQAFELEYLLRPLTATVQIEWAVREDGTIDPAWGERLRPELGELAAHITKRDGPSRDAKLSAICQLISDRYYPKTQGDERHVTIPMGMSHFHDWDWYAYARQWDAAGVAVELSVDKAELRGLYERVFLLYRTTDPLEKWRGLVRFVKIAKRKQLK
ncbi:MAG: hypothetical protein ACRCV5_09490, partial [Afipia sp.]